MTRRLMLVMVGTAVVIMLVAGAGLWLLARQSARNQAIDEVQSAAVAFGKTPLANGERAVSATAFKNVVRPLLGLSARINGAKLVEVSGG